MTEPQTVSSPNSESSLDSVKVYDRSKAKPGPGALHPSAFDPLKHEDYECFWSDIDKYFYPITTNDVHFLRTIPLNAYGAAGDEALLLSPSSDEKRNGKPDGTSGRDRLASGGKDKSIGRDAAISKDSGPGHSKSAAVRGTSTPVDFNALPSDPSILNSYPLTQRLVAALIDEGGGGTPSSAPQRPARGAAADIESFWPGIGAEGELRTYQKALDLRVAHELKEAGLLTDADIGDEMQAELRHEQWKLRDVKTGNKARKNSVYMLIVGTELRRQAFRRDHKKFMDETEIAYLNRMIKKLKKNKKARNKYPKLLQKMFKNHPKQQRPPTNILQSPVPVVTPASGNGGHSAVGGSASGIGNSARAAGSSASAIHGSRGSTGGGGGASLGIAPEHRAISKGKSAKKKKRKGDSSSRPPPASKSAASKGRGSGRDDMDLL